MTMRNVKTHLMVFLVVGLMGSGVGALHYHASIAPAAEQPGAAPRDEARSPERELLAPAERPKLTRDLEVALAPPAVTRANDPAEKTGSAPQALTPPAVGTRSLHTRIGLINMARVLKDSKLAQTAEADLRQQTQQLQKTLASLRKQLQHNAAVYLDPATPPRQKEHLNQDIRLLQRDVREEEAAVRAKLAELNGKACLRLYRAIEDAANRLAKANELELVLFYTDAVTEADFYNTENMQRKLTLPGALMPMIVAPGMDITETLIEALNRRHEAASSK